MVNSFEVEVLDLDNFAGGLTPTRRGGGLQTKSLRLAGADGKEYKFRSVTKDPKKVLPPALRESLAADILQDQISSSNPMAALIVAPLLNAVGVLNSQPQMVLMPNTPKLGEFQSEFGGLLGTIEENPDEAEPDNKTGAGSAGFENADKIVGSIKFFKTLKKDNDERIDEREFIKARLMDIFLGDWDRHIDQWRWAGYYVTDNDSINTSPKGKIRRWAAIPRDRDQAFARFNGLLPWIASIAIPQLEGFGEILPEIEDLTWSGRFVDRRLMAGMTWPVWDSIASTLRAQLTDNVIEQAVSILPEEMYALEGEAMIRALKIRRDDLSRAAREYYELTSEYPEIRLSDKREFVEVSYLPGRMVDVSIFKRHRVTGDKNGGPFFQRVYAADETHEIRIFLHGGDDFVTVSGERSATTSLIVVGGKGDDEIIDRSTGGGLAYVAPLSLFSTPAVTIYDEDPKTRYSSLTNLNFDSSPLHKPATELEKYEPPVRDYGYDWKFAPFYGINPDEGLFVGGGPILYKHGFRAEPYVYRLQLRGGYATTAERARMDLSGDFYTIIPQRRVNIVAEFSQIDLLNYYGHGNSTAMSDSLQDAGFYKARSQHFLISPTLVLPVSDRTRVTIGTMVKTFRPDPQPGTVLRTLVPFGYDRRSWYGSFRLEVLYDSRDLPATATRGILGVLNLSTHHPLVTGFESFQKLSGELRTYITPGDLPVTFATRVGAEKNWGIYPWNESVFLGGTGNGTLPLRGYEKQRFAGDAGFYGAIEMRMRLSSFNLLLPGRIGITVTGETGRVFSAGESSDVWHGAVGGGVWFSVINTANVLGISYLRSIEGDGLYLATGFTF